MQLAQLAMNKEELQAFLDEIFPQVRGDFVVEALEPMNIVMRLPVSEKHLRPGGTVSGPAMFALCDVAVYAGILAMIGKKALAVTTNCSLDFMRKPEAGKDLIAKCEILKLGRVLAVGDVKLYSEGDARPVARATMTYSIPPK